jgi:hypothetical protein
MNDDKRSTMQYSPVEAPARNVLGIPSHLRNNSPQTKAKLSEWEGEGGAVKAPVAAAPAPAPDEDRDEETEVTDVIDTIAYIEMNRQVMAKEQGIDMARTDAVRKLHEALALEQDLARGSGANPAHAANADALMNELQRVKGMSQGQRSGASSQKASVLRVPAGNQPAPRSPGGRSRVRRNNNGRPGTR